MMEFIDMNANNLRVFLNRFNMRDLLYIVNYVLDNFESEDIKALGMSESTTKTQRSKFKKIYMVDFLIKIKESLYFRQCFHEALAKTEASRYIYGELIWKKNFLDTQTLSKKVGMKFKKIEEKGYHREDYALENELALVERIFYQGYDEERDIIKIKNGMGTFLKLFYPVPDDYNLKAIKEPPVTQYHYNNEDAILPFIQQIEEMLSNKLIVFGKTNEKPMVKSLNLLKSSNLIEEFYEEKGMNSLALDMLTRSFYYFKERFEFKKKELGTLNLFMEYQLKNAFSFTISRMFTSHLKKVRFGRYMNEEKELFETFKYLMTQMPTEGWVKFENILNHTYYRDLYFDFEDRYRTQDYEFVSSQKEKWGNGNRVLEVGDHHAELFHEPVLKGLFFYMGALGVLELKYDDPLTPYKEIKAKDKPYISVWDGLKYIKLTELGEYLLGFKKSYTPKKIVAKKTANVKFDEFKPIITVDKSDTLFIAKIEAYTEKLDNERYILTHAKLFRECKNLKELKEKIERFYITIEKHPPKVFKDFFDEVIENSNLMKRNLKQVVIELKENKKLLNLFMTNRKLQSLLIKAEGYRIIVFKDDIPKVTKIVKENGFFLEF